MNGRRTNAEFGEPFAGLVFGAGSVHSSEMTIGSKLTIL